MKLDGADKESLRQQYQQQLQQCGKVPISWSPAKHRSTQIDTERVLPGTSDSHSVLAAVTALRSPKHSISANSKATRAHSSKRGAAGSKQAATIKAAELEPQPASVYRTEFCKDGAEQQRLSQLTTTRRVLQGSSEWALLDQLEHSIAEQEVAVRQALQQQVQQQQKQQLDAQVQEHERARQAAAAAKAADLAAAAADVAAHQAEEAAKEEAARTAAAKLKADREQQSAAAEAARKRAATKKAREEAALLASIEKQMAAAKQAAAAKAADAKAAMEAARKANEEALAVKQRAAKEQQANDERLMVETIRTLQRQEEAREAALKAFHDNIAARAVQAGAAAVAENRGRAEREERLVAASKAWAKAEAEAKHAAEVAKRAAMAADMKAAAAATAAAKAAAQQVAQQEQTKTRLEMEAQLQQFRLCESLTAAQRRQRNAQYKAALEAQIAEAEARAVLDDVFMAERERALNRRLIVTACGMMAGLGQGP
ncbi:hypothetical protein OEZ86_003606 [Tetradesmus obliquus]|nr:hypothetical protein OEZ86_003606 [Tetradesmus obliquus]